MDDEILDKTLVHIDSSSVEFQGNDKWIFNVNLLEPLRDVVYIMILKTEVTLIKSDNVFKINYNELGKHTYGLDSYPIHIHMNDFKRHSCVVSKFASDTLTLGSDLVQELDIFVKADKKPLSVNYDTIIGNPPAESNIQHVANNPTLNRIGDTYIISDDKIYFDKLKNLRDSLINDLTDSLEEPDITEDIIKSINVKINNIKNLTDPLINAFTKFYDTVVQNENEKHIAKYFEHIPVNINNVLTTTQDILTFGNQIFATFHRNNQNVHVLNPIEPNLQRLNFELRDKYDNPIDKNNISQFNMTLCFYQNSRKISRG